MKLSTISILSMISLGALAHPHGGDDLGITASLTGLSASLRLTAATTTTNPITSTSTLGLSFSVSGTALTALPSSLPTPLETLSLSLSINTAATARRPVFPTGRIRPQPTNACTVTYAPTDTLLLEDSGSGKNNTVTTTEQKCLQDCYPDAQAKVFSKCPMMEPHQCHCLNAVRRWCALGCGVKWVGIVGCPSAPRGGVGAL